MFFETGTKENPDPVGQPSLFDRACVKQLKEAVFTSGKKMRRVIRDQMWAKHFTYLRKKDKRSKKSITRVLTWYCDNLKQKNEWLPQAYSKHLSPEI